MSCTSRILLVRRIRSPKVWTRFMKSSPIADLIFAATARKSLSIQASSPSWTRAALLRSSMKASRLEARDELRVATRGIQQACVALLVDRMNELARTYRTNKTKIDKLRWQLSVVRKAVQR